MIWKEERVCGYFLCAHCFVLKIPKTNSLIDFNKLSYMLLLLCKMHENFHLCLTRIKTTYSGIRKLPTMPVASALSQTSARYFGTYYYNNVYVQCLNREKQGKGMPRFYLPWLTRHFDLHAYSQLLLFLTKRHLQEKMMSCFYMYWFYMHAFFYEKQWTKNLKV